MTQTSEATTWQEKLKLLSTNPEGLRVLIEYIEALKVETYQLMTKEAIASLMDSSGKTQRAALIHFGAVQQLEAILIEIKKVA